MLTELREGIFQLWWVPIGVDFVPSCWMCLLMLTETTKKTTKLHPRTRRPDMSGRTLGGENWCLSTKRSLQLAVEKVLFPKAAP